jgi:peptidoglycan/LPS O-acetylase OafA/YrhL
VTIFFVISGFILPYSLWKGGFKLSDYGRFILKRIMRLDPPYFASIAIALATAYVATQFPLYRGVGFSISWTQLLLHVGYLNAFFGKPWIVSAYWTLAVEFQFYLILGLAFPFLKSSNRLQFCAFVGACVVSQRLLLSEAFLPYHWPLFLMGIVVFRYRSGIVDAGEAISWIVGFSCWMAFAAVTDEARGWEMAMGHTIIGTISALTIMYLEFGNPVMFFLGEISYSLYLIHSPIGSKVVNLAARYIDGPFPSLLVAFFATGISIGCAYALYRWVERPAQRLASKIRYAGETSEVQSVEPAASVSP